MILESVSIELIRQLPGILEGLACIIFAVLGPAAVVKSMKAYSASIGSNFNKGGNRHA